MTDIARLVGLGTGIVGAGAVGAILGSGPPRYSSDAGVSLGMGATFATLGGISLGAGIAGLGAHSAAAKDGRYAAAVVGVLVLSMGLSQIVTTYRAMRDQSFRS